MKSKINHGAIKLIDLVAIGATGETTVIIANKKAIIAAKPGFSLKAVVL